MPTHYLVSVVPVPAPLQLFPMPPSPCPLVFDDFPSSPSSAWSFGTGSPSPSSAAQDHPSPPTPDSYFSPAPTIVSPDEFALQIDHRLDKPSFSPPAAGAYYLSGADTTKEQVLLRNMGRRENMYDWFESSPPLRPRNIPHAPPVPPDDATDYFSLETTQPTLANANELSDPLRYSVLIHEVSLLVGLTADDDHLMPGDGSSLVPNGSEQVPDILPPSLLVGLTADDDHLMPGDGSSLVPNGSEQVPDILPPSLPPTRSLVSRKQRNVSPPHSTNSPSNNPISSSINPHADLPDVRMLIEKQSSVGSTEFSAPVPRRKTPSAVRPSPSPHRRHGQVFHFKPPLPESSHRRAIDLDKTFVHPREPPPTPTSSPLSNRCSSLDRLERSLLKLEAYAPDNHRQSQSEERRSSNHVVQRKDKCPSLPPPRRSKKQHSDHEHLRRSPSHPAHGSHPSGSSQPLSKPAPLHQYVTPQNFPVVPLYDEPRGEDNGTPGSFMDMDIPQTEASQKPQASLPSKKMKNLIIVARRLSRGVIAWGKNLAGPTKPLLEGTTTVQSPHL